MQALSADDAERFLKAAAEDRYGLLFAVALATGMRPEEYLALQWKDVDLKGCCLINLPSLALQLNVAKFETILARASSF
jgi:integrase